MRERKEMEMERHREEYTLDEIVLLVRRETLQNALTVLDSLAPPPAISGVLGGVARPFEPIESMLATAALRSSSNLEGRRENRGESGGGVAVERSGNSACGCERDGGRGREGRREKERKREKERG
jgi:hypothetical protein